ncbi:hypothetical protein D9619_008165 [Psilocybe cf. subviscida]|uniref:Protein kinase domain-containing protein n=1 Tax=Psilocybe cf. subviscida TaxID=2480587 RepID=A0A8H5ESV1_9AGAR|nr:hypothetical protein D9619_008165 [Psilocybe cf. subviscida]
MSSKPSPPATSPNHPAVGTLIDGGALQLVEVLGVGGYGVVYRAVDPRHPSKSYAVKCLVASGHQSPRQRQIHIREIALHQLASAHPGVVTLHRVIDQGNHTYIVMDYASDHDLFTQILHSCRYLGQNDLIKDIFLQLIDAVQYCHSLGIYHRDLKPENVLCFDGGLRVSVSDFGLATTDKVSDEFRTGSVYHMSPECQGGDYAPTGHYSPMFNDIWSLGIILLNLATGRNPWKSATPSDPTFQAYLRDPEGFLPTVLPISSEVNDILVRMLDVDWRDRANLREVRHAIERVSSFYSEGAIFEGSMARCPWESGMDIDSASSGSNVDDSGPASPPAQSSISDDASRRLASHWSKDSASDMVFAAPSYTAESSYGQPWNTYSSCGATWDIESPVSSDSDYDRGFHMDFDRAHTPASNHTAETSLPNTPDSFNLTFGARAEKPDLRLMIDNNMPPPRIYDADPSMTSFSPNTSIMHTAIEYDPYSSMFFVNSPASPKQQRPFGVPDSALTAVGTDKEMTSPTTLWSAVSATQMSSPSIYSNSSASSSVADENVSFSRSSTPSPEVDTWMPSPVHDRLQPLQGHQCQLSSSVSTAITESHVHSRQFSRPALRQRRRGGTVPSRGPPSPYARMSPSTPVSVAIPGPMPATGVIGSSTSGKSSTLIRLASRLFTRSPSPSTPTTPPGTALPARRGATAEPSHPPFSRREAPAAPYQSPAWSHHAQVGPSDWHRQQQQQKGRSGEGAITRRADSPGSGPGEHHQLRSARNWFLPGCFRTGVN